MRLAAPYRHMQTALGTVTLCLGAVVVLGWRAGLTPLVQPAPDWTPMAYNTAVCFILNGLGLLTLGRGRWWWWLPAAALLLAAASLAEEVLGVDLGLAQLLFTPYATSHTPFPGHMAPNTALAQLVVAGAIAALSWSPGSPAGVGAALVGWFVTGLALVGLTGYATGIEAAYHWGPFASMAPNTAAGLVLLGLGLVAAGASRARQRSTLALGAALAATTMTAALARAIASFDVSTVHPDSLAAATLALGLTMALLVGLSVHSWQIARVRADELEHANLELSAVAERARLLSAAVEQAGEGIVITDLSGAIQYVNPACDRLTGYSREELIGKNVRLLKSGQQPPAFYRELWSTIVDGRPWRGDIVNRRKDGSLYLEAMSITPINDAAGAVTHFVAIKEDVTERRAADAALLSSERKFRLLFERTADALLLLDPVMGAFVDCNQAAVDMLRCPDENDVLSLHPAELSPPHQPDGRRSREKADEMIATALEKGSHRFEWVHRSPHRAAFPVEVLLTPIEIGDRRLIITTWRDITERKRIDDALQRLAAIVENTTDLVGQADAQGRLSYINSAGQRMLGAKRAEDVIGRPILDFHTAESASRLVGDGLPAALRDGVWAGETELLGLDGRVVPVSQVIMVGRAADGTVTHTSTIMRDLSERSRAEAVLRNREFWLRESQRVGRIGSYELDLRTQTWVSSEVLDDILGIERDAERTLASWNALVHPDEREEMLQYFLETVLAHRQPFDREYRIVRARDGAVRWVWGRGALTDDGALDPVRMIGTIQDVTERRHLEDQLRQSQKIEAIGQLAGGVAHDFNNILGVITGYGELLSRDIGPGHPGTRRLQQIMKAADRAAGLTRQLLAFSRKQVLQPKVLDLNAVVQGIEGMLRRLIGEDVDLMTAPCVDLGQVSADPGAIEQVIMNLTVNARDAMPSGGMVVIETANVDLDESYVRANVGSQPGPHVMLAMSDTGHGMDAETMQHIFEPFFTTKELGKGTGLGLSTVFGIVKQSGGHVGVYSEVGRGTTFRVYLPRIDAAATTPSEAGAATAPGPRGNETVLLAEDDEALRAMIRDALEGAGYEVIESSRPEHALAQALAHEGPIHLALTDMVMPGMSGPELARRLTEARPGTKVLYMSGYADAALVLQGALDAGSSFIGKPFTPDALLRRMAEVLRAPRDQTS